MLPHSISAVPSAPPVASDPVDDSILLPAAVRHVFKSGYVLLRQGDEFACEALSKKIITEAPNSLIDRTHKDYARMIGNMTFNGAGAMMVGLVDPHNHLVGFAGLELMDDESDPGSGPVVHYKGRKNHEEQAYLKSLGILKAFQGNGHFSDFFHIRGAICKLTGRDFMVLKTASPLLAEIYENKFGLLNLSKHDHPELELVYESEKARQDRVVDVLVLPLDEFRENTAGIVMPPVSILKHDSQPTLH